MVGQKSKVYWPGSLEILTGSREEEATAAADRATIATTIVPTASPVANPRIAPLYFSVVRIAILHETILGAILAQTQQK